jgi:hypothetical protein
LKKFIEIMLSRLLDRLMKNAIPWDERHSVPKNYFGRVY